MKYFWWFILSLPFLFACQKEQPFTPDLSRYSFSNSAAWDSANIAPDGSRLCKILHFYNDQETEPYFYRTFQYDTDGKLLRENVHQPQDFLASYILNEYLYGLRIASNFFYYDGFGYTKLSSETYEYDGFGRRAIRKSYDQSGVLNQLAEYRYDGFSQLVAHKEFSTNSGIVLSTPFLITRYDYNPAGSLISKKATDGSGVPSPFINECLVWEYDTTERLTEFCSCPNDPTSSLSKFNCLKYEYNGSGQIQKAIDQNGNIAEIREYENGKLTRRTFYEGFGGWQTLHLRYEYCN